MGIVYLAIGVVLGAIVFALGRRGDWHWGACLGVALVPIGFTFCMGLLGVGIGIAFAVAMARATA